MTAPPVLSQLASAARSGGTLGELIIGATNRYPERTAFIIGDQNHTYRDTAHAISRAMQQLSALGLKKGDTVAQLSGNQPEVFFIIAAIYMLGLRSVSLHGMSSAEDHAFIVNDCEASVFISGPGYEARAAQLQTRCPGIKAWFAQDTVAGLRNFWEEAAHFEAQPLRDYAEPEDIVRLAYTGGTTGRPKGVMLSNRALTANAVMFLAEKEWPEPLRILCSAPISHGAGAMIIPMLWLGGSMVLQQGFDKDRVLDAIEKYRITKGYFVPTMLYALLDHPRTRKADLSSLQLIVYGASPMAPARIREAMEVFGPILSQGYGQTEAPNAILMLRKGDHQADDELRLSATGVPYPGISLRLFDDDDQEVAPGEIGEICVRGPLVMSGYWKQPEETARALRNGWLHTGDLAYCDAQGFYHIVDRKKDLIISGGFNVYPREVEDVITAHPAVAAAAVIGVPDEKWGEAVKAIVVLRSGANLSADELITLVRDRKGAVHAPKTVDFVETLPTTAVGKPDKKVLRAKYWSGTTRAVN